MVKFQPSRRSGSFDSCTRLFSMSRPQFILFLSQLIGAKQMAKKVKVKIACDNTQPEVESLRCSCQLRGGIFSF